MTLPVLRVRHHSVIGGRDDDVPACASVGPAGEVAALWTTPEGLGPVTSTTVSAAGAWFPDPAAAPPGGGAHHGAHAGPGSGHADRGPGAGAYHLQPMRSAPQPSAGYRSPVQGWPELVSLAGAASNSTDSLLTGSGVLPDSFPLEPGGVT